MRLITITKLVAVSVVLLGGTPAFAARTVHPDVHRICGEQNAAYCGGTRFNVEIPGAVSNPRATADDAQAKANAASKTWPGDMVLD
jgi:hypothetical protein